MDGWNTSFLLGWSIFRDYVTFREGNKFVLHTIYILYIDISIIFSTLRQPQWPWKGSFPWRVHKTSFTQTYISEGEAPKSFKPSSLPRFDALSGNFSLGKLTFPAIFLGEDALYLNNFWKTLNMLQQNPTKPGFDRPRLMMSTTRELQITREKMVTWNFGTTPQPGCLSPPELFHS